MMLTADVNTVPLLVEALADSAVSEVTLAPGEYLIDIATQPVGQRGKLFVRKPLRGSDPANRPLLVFIDQYGHWPGIWVNTTGTALSRASGVLAAGANAVTVDDGEVMPAVGDWVIGEWGVAREDPLEPRIIRWHQVAAVNGRTITFTPAIDEAIPTYPEGTVDWVYPSGSAEQQDKVGATGTLHSSGREKRGWGDKHKLRRFPGGKPTRNVVLRDLNLRLDGPDGNGTGQPGITFQFARDAIVENVTVDKFSSAVCHFWHSSNVRLRNVNGTNGRESQAFASQIPHPGQCLNAWGSTRIVWSDSSFSAVNVRLCSMEGAAAEVEAINWTAQLDNGLASYSGSFAELSANAGRSNFTLKRSTVTGTSQRSFELQGTLARGSGAKFRAIDCTFDMSLPGRFWYTRHFEGQVKLSGTIPLTLYPIRKVETVTESANLRASDGWGRATLENGIFRRVFVPDQPGLTNVEHIDGNAATREANGWRLHRLQEWRGGNTYDAGWAPGMAVWGPLQNGVWEFQVELDWWPDPSLLSDAEIDDLNRPPHRFVVDTTPHRKVAIVAPQSPPAAMPEVIRAFAAHTSARRHAPDADSKRLTANVSRRRVR